MHNKRRAFSPPLRSFQLSAARAVMTLKAAAVDTLDVGRIALMSRDVDGIERAVILVALMMLAVLDGTVDMIISGSFVIHCFHLNLIFSDSHS